MLTRLAVVRLESDVDRDPSLLSSNEFYLLAFFGSEADSLWLLFPFVRIEFTCCHFCFPLFSLEFCGRARLMPRTPASTEGCLSVSDQALSV